MEYCTWKGELIEIAMGKLYFHTGFSEIPKFNVINMEIRIKYLGMGKAWGWF